MRSGNQLQSIDMAEISGDFRPEDPPCTTGVDGPILDVFRVWPHEVTEGSFVRDFYLAVDGSDLIDGLDFGGEATMHAEDTAWIRKEIPSMTAPMGR